MHNDNKIYVNPEGKELIIFVKETNHDGINRIPKNAVDKINVVSEVVPTPEEVIQDQDSNILEQLLEYPCQCNGVDLGGEYLYNVDSD